MKPKHQRLAFALAGLAMLGGAVALMLDNFRDNILFYYTPTELQKNPPGATALRLGGLVKPGSIERGAGAALAFTVTDGAHETTVHFSGALPSLFREGQGVVAEGRLTGGVMQADRILAKHDENYMPPEVARMLKQQGHWQEDTR